VHAAATCIFHWQHYDQRSEAIHDQHKDS